MALLTPDYLDDQLYPAVNDRYLIQQAGGGVVRSGIVNKGDYAVAQHAAGANFTVDVAAGSCLIVGTDAVRQGVYHVVNDGTINVAGFPVADASNPRIDSLYLQVQDATLLGIGADIAQFVIQPGTPAAGATLTNLSGKSATVPPSSVLLAHVLIPAAAGVIVNADIGAYIDPSSTSRGALAGAPPAYAYGRPISYTPLASIYGGAQSPANNAVSDVNLNTLRWDNDNLNTVTGQIVIKTPGLYLITGHLAWSAGGGIGTTRVLILRYVNTNIEIDDDARNASNNGQIRQSFHSAWRYGYGDALKMQVYQDSGAARALETSNFVPELTAAWIGP